MSDRTPSWAAQHAALLDALRAQQRALEDGWASSLDAWLRAWQSGGARSAGGVAADHLGSSGARASSSDGAANRETRATSLGPIDWYVRAARETVDAIGALSSGAASPSPIAWDDLSRLAGITARQVSFGPIEPEFARRSAELSETGLACLAAMQRYESLHRRALFGIAERFLDGLSAEGDDGRAPPDSLRALFERWIESGDRVLLELYRSDAYLAVQRELLEGLMRYRVQWQTLQDAFGRAAGRPTRDELDDVHRSIHELRRELRAQRRLQRDPMAAVATATGTTRAPSEDSGVNRRGAERGGTHGSGAKGNGASRSEESATDSKEISAKGGSAKKRGRRARGRKKSGARESDAK